MAFGKPPDTKVIKVTPNIEDQLWRAYVHSEEITKEAWKTNWGWILEEYNKLHDDLEVVTKNSVTIPPPAKKEVPETRTTQPLPNSTAHECGWLAKRKEFKLEKYGSDVYKGMPFKSLGGD